MLARARSSRYNDGAWVPVISASWATVWVPSASASARCSRSATWIACGFHSWLIKFPSACCGGVTAGYTISSWWVIGAGPSSGGHSPFIGSQFGSRHLPCSSLNSVSSSDATVGVSMACPSTAYSWCTSSGSSPSRRLSRVNGPYCPACSAGSKGGTRRSTFGHVARSRSTARSAAVRGARR